MEKIAIIIELQDREFVSAFRKCPEFNACVVQELPCYRVLASSEHQHA